MTCQRFLSMLDGLDNDEMPRDMVIHARSCPACAAEEAALRAAIGLYRLPDLLSDANIVPKVTALLPFVPAPRRNVSMRDWLLVGFILMVSIVLVPLLAEFRALKALYGSGFSVTISLALGTIVTVYACMFILSHLDEFSRRLKDRETRLRGRAA